MAVPSDVPGFMIERPRLHGLSRVWWLILLRGLASIAFGIVAFAWPGITLVTLALFYGVFVLIDGVLSLIAAFSGRVKTMPTWWLIMVGLLGIAAGLVTLLWPALTGFLLVMFIGAWALVHGVFEIIGAIQLRKEIDNEWTLIFGGLLSVIFGAILLIMPGSGAVGLIWAIAAYAVVVGILLVALSLKLRARHHTTGRSIQP